MGLSNHNPSLIISWDPAKLHVTGEEVAEELAHTKKLRSITLERGTEDSILFIFASTGSADVSSGTLLPGGPPLAN